MKIRILVADDDPGIRDILTIILSKAGYDVEVTGDGSELLKDKFSTPDLFLIDRLMSGIDGLDICQYLKTSKATSHIPVVMISASPDIGIMASKAGADDFVEKPFDITYLLKVIDRNISRPKTERSVSKAQHNY